MIRRAATHELPFKVQDTESITSHYLEGGFASIECLIAARADIEMVDDEKEISIRNFVLSGDPDIVLNVPENFHHRDFHQTCCSL